MESSPFGCFRCNGTDHWETACPELVPVQTRKEHEERIARYVQWMWDGRVTPQQKRKLIEAENQRWARAQKERKAS